MPRGLDRHPSLVQRMLEPGFYPFRQPSLFRWFKRTFRLFGYRSAEMVGSPITMLIPPDRLAEEERILSRLRRGQRINHYETLRAQKDGRRIAVSISVSPSGTSAAKSSGRPKSPAIFPTTAGHGPPLWASNGLPIAWPSGSPPCPPK
jgi:PAS domain S-box-containing protein